MSNLEWLLCLFPEIQPSLLLEDLQSTNPTFHLPSLKVLNNDFSLLKFLPHSVCKDLMNDKNNWYKLCQTHYFPESASSFLKKLSILHRWTPNKSNHNVIFNYNSKYLFPDEKWESQSSSDTSLLNPQNMLFFLHNFYNDNFEPNKLKIKVIQTYIKQKFYVHYLHEFLSLIGDKQIYNILKDKISDTNFYSVLKFVRSWNPTATEAINCKRSFIRTLSPLIQQIIFAPPSCWYDSQTDPCEKCLIEKWDMFLPQLRCTALLCGVNKQQCHRFVRHLSDFCLYHELQKPKKYLKRQYEKPDHDIDSTQYLQDPYNEDIDQPVRYHLTRRAVNPMVKIVPREEDNNPELFQSLTIAAKTKSSKLKSFLQSINPNSQQDDKKPIKKYQKGCYLPVVRYENTYYSESDIVENENETYCGKFFYFEPESNVYLFLGKSCFFASKIDALFHLNIMKNGLQHLKEHLLKPDNFGYRKFKYTVSNLDFPLFLSDHYEPEGILKQIFDSEFIGFNLHYYLNKENPKITQKEYVSFWDQFLTYRYRTLFLSIDDFDPMWHHTLIPVFYPTDQLTNKNKTIIPLQSTVTYGPENNGVAEHDKYDQTICNLAKELGFDTIVLQHEIGNNDSVTEILHTGKFSKNLVEINGITLFKEQQKIYPKIWFPKENGLLFIDENQTKKYIYIDSNPKLQQIFPLTGTRNNHFKTESFRKRFGVEKKLPQKKFQSHTMEYKFKEDLKESDSESNSESESD